MESGEQYQENDIEEVMLNDFRNEMQAIVEEEFENANKVGPDDMEGKAATGHFRGIVFNKDELTSDDMWVWEKIKAGTVKNEDLFELSKQVQSEYYAKWGNKTGQPLLSDTTRGSVLGYFGNKATSLIWERDREGILAAAKKNRKKI